MRIESFLRHSVGIAILMGGWTSVAQQAPLASDQMQPDASLSVTLTAPASSSASILTPEPATGPFTVADLSVPLPPEPASASSGMTRIPRVYNPRIADRHYFLLNGLHLALGSLDIALTQHCIADHHCHEGNPMMPSSLGGQLGINFAFVAYGSLSSYWLKKNHSRVWWIAPVAGIAGHSAGAVTGFMHQ